MKSLSHWFPSRLDVSCHPAWHNLSSWIVLIGISWQILSNCLLNRQHFGLFELSSYSNPERALLIRVQRAELAKAVFDNLGEYPEHLSYASEHYLVKRQVQYEAEDIKPLVKCHLRTACCKCSINDYQRHPAIKGNCIAGRKALLWTCC